MSFPAKSNRLRVAIDATPLLGNPTGVGAFCHGALWALSDRHELDINAFAVSWRGRGDLNANLPANITSNQRPMPARPLHALWRKGSIPKLDCFIGEVDVVHGTNFVAPPAKRAGSLVTVHDLTPLHYPDLCTKAAQAYPQLIRHALKRGAWVHAVSNFVAAEVIEAFNVPPERVVAIAHGVPALPAVEPEMARITVSRVLPPGTSRYILAIATAEPRKDLPGLVRAFDQFASRHSDLALVLVGPPGWGENAVTLAIRQARAGQRVVRTGWVNAPVLACLLDQAEVLAYPSIYEGFGFPPLQAMAAGVPVVATRTGAIPEVLGDAAELVEVGDTTGLAAALQRVIFDEELRARLVADGSARAMLFSWKNCGDGLAGIYERIAECRE